MVEISRIKKAMENKKFLEKILGAEEYEQLGGKGFKAQSVAANFCAKEAFSKSIGIGFRGFGFRNVQVMRDDLGRPYLKLDELIYNIIGSKKYDFSVSVTHTEKYASAVVICMKEEGIINGGKGI